MTFAVPRKSIRPLSAVALIAVAASVISCAGKVRYPNYYVLSIPSQPASHQQRDATLGSVAVREFRSPEYLRRGSIVYRPSPQELAFYDYHRWAADPRGAVSSALISKIQARGLFKSVGLFDGRSNP